MTRALLTWRPNSSRLAQAPGMKPKHVRTSRRKPLSGKSTTPPRAEDNRDAALADAIGAAAATAAIEVPPIPRLIADDCTPEAAASPLAEHGGRLAIISA